MPKILKAILFFCATFLFAHQAKAETYFLKIEQMDTKGQKPFLQTCSPKTSPCTFTIPITFEKGEIKNVTVVMRIKESPYIYLQFYWDQVLLATNNAGEKYYTLLAGTSDAKTDPRIIKIYTPLPAEQTPRKDKLVLKYSEKLITTLRASATADLSQE
jgi:hypothetical protein